MTHNNLLAANGSFDLSVVIWTTFIASRDLINLSMDAMCSVGHGERE